MRLFCCNPHRNLDATLSHAAPGLPRRSARHETSAQNFGPGKKAWLQHKYIRTLLALLVCSLTLTLGMHMLAPVLTRSLANNLPSNWVRSSSEQVLTALDARQLQPSLEDSARQVALQSRFAGLTAPAEGAPPYRLLFRRTRAPSPLLFALPSGDIVVSDQLFKTVPDPDMQLALLCQELGHLQYQHALREAVRHKLFWLASAALAGSAESSIKALSEGLLRANYHLAHLNEADRYAQAMLSANGFPPSLLQTSISRFGDNTAPGQLTRMAPLTALREERTHALQTPRS